MCLKHQRKQGGNDLLRMRREVTGTFPFSLLRKPCFILCLALGNKSGLGNWFSSVCGWVRCHKTWGFSWKVIKGLLKTIFLPGSWRKKCLLKNKKIKIKKRREKCEGSPCPLLHSTLNLLTGVFKAWESWPLSCVDEAANQRPQVPNAEYRQQRKRRKRACLLEGIFSPPSILYKPWNRLATDLLFK